MFICTSGANVNSFDMIPQKSLGQNTQCITACCVCRPVRVPMMGTPPSLEGSELFWWHTGNLHIVFKLISEYTICHSLLLSNKTGLALFSFPRSCESENYVTHEHTIALDQLSFWRYNILEQQISTALLALLALSVKCSFNISKVFNLYTAVCLLDAVLPLNEMVPPCHQVKGGKERIPGILNGLYLLQCEDRLCCET